MAWLRKWGIDYDPDYSRREVTIFIETPWCDISCGGALHEKRVS